MATKFENDEFKFPDEKEEKNEEKTSSDDFELEIENDTPPEDRGRKSAPPPQDPTDEELSTYSREAQDRLKKFTRGYHDERRAKEAAERERLAAEEFARNVYEENKRLKEQLKTGSEVYIETAKTAAQTELDVAKKKLKEAFEAGDSDALVMAQEEMSKAALKIDRAQTMRPIEIEQQQEFKPAAQQPAISAKTKRWMDKNNDWFGVDEEMTLSAVGLDKKLQKQYGADYVGTDEYFQEVDRTMRKRFPEYFRSHEDNDDPSQNSSNPAEDESPRRAKPSTPVAPATRSTPPSRVKLKASQVSLARRLGITPEQYAKQVALLNRGE
ncbi:hypothetical protein EBT31_02100 [bacterium]|jgi:hypothetical protein|nr:hypothetical protein [bacterium]